MTRRNHLKSLITTISFGISLLACCPDRWDQVESQFDSIGVKLYAYEGTEYQECFKRKLGEYKHELEGYFHTSCPTNNTLPDITVNLVAEHPSLGDYWPGRGIVILAPSRQLAVFGHEYVRQLCAYTSCCDWYHSSYDWTGFIGQCWNYAESLAYSYCG